MTKVFLLLIYMIITPLSLGIINELFFKEVYKESYSLIGLLLKLFSRGLIWLFVLFELLTELYKKLYSSYDIIMNNLIHTWKIISIIIICFGIVILLICRNDIKKIEFIKNEKTLIFRYLFLFAYICIAVLFVLPSNLDNTINIVVETTQNGIITDNYTIYYIMLSNMLGIGLVPFIHYIINTLLLLFVFGVYEQIERSIYHFNPKFKELKPVISIMFGIYFVLLIFIRGSIYSSIPQNIWNAYTFLASAILPLSFIWAYEFYIDKNKWNIINLLLLMIVSNMFYRYSFIYILIQLLISFTLMIIGKINNLSQFRDKKEY